ncbi:hypothetical protein HK100_007675, partial [Physocladia obscura]
HVAAWTTRRRTNAGVAKGEAWTRKKRLRQDAAREQDGHRTRRLGFCALFLLNLMPSN